MTENKIPKINLLNYRFPLTFKITERETEDNCFFEFTDKTGKQWRGFEISSYGAMCLRSHFEKLGYTEIFSREQMEEYVKSLRTK